MWIFSLHKQVPFCLQNPGWIGVCNGETRKRICKISIVLQLIKTWECQMSWIERRLPSTGMNWQSFRRRPGPIRAVDPMMIMMIVLQFDVVSTELRPRNRVSFLSGGKRFFSLWNRCDILVGKTYGWRKAGLTGRIIFKWSYEMDLSGSTKSPVASVYLYIAKDECPPWK